MAVWDKWFSKRDNESNGDYARRIRANEEKATRNYKAFLEARKLGVIVNGMQYDDYLKAKGESTDSHPDHELGGNVSEDEMWWLDD